MKVYGITDAGLVRGENQDTFATANLFDGCVAAVVCDGMGGVNGGQVASALATKTFFASLRKQIRPDMSPVQVREAASFSVAQANRAVYEQAQRDSTLEGMGTTLVAAIVMGSTAVICNVGDSRAYHVRPDGMTQITHDHSLVNDLVSKGSITPEEARHYPGRNLITRALGPERDITCDSFSCELKKEDRLLLCSDGLVVTLKDEEIRTILAKEKTPDECLERMMALAKRRGAPDNVTAVIIQEGGEVA